MAMYSAAAVEKKWQKIWEKSGLYDTDLEATKKPKYYALVMFPYPSGDKLHVGHWYNFAPADSWARYMRMQGYNVFEPMGYDAFGLPAENYAIKTGIHPHKTTSANVKTMRKQLKAMGAMYDWSQEINTSVPDYYKWTQWVFLKLYEKGLAYRKQAPVNWCPSCQTVLANEQVQDGTCDRCHSEVTKKNLTQWFFKIREYAEQLLDYSHVDWPEKTIAMQQHWIGRSEGSQVIFQIDKHKKEMPVFTTRVDTLFSAAFVVLAPEHPLVAEITILENQTTMRAYCEQAKHKTDIERGAEDKEKTGVPTGAFAVNPINGERMPILVADFVLMHYGTGAVFGDAHDERDFAFAKKYKIPLKTTIKPADGRDDHDIRALKECFTEDGILYDSGEFSGMTSAEARKAITKKLSAQKAGKFVVNYKLRDWLLSRQRYWGAPIPIVYCKDCGAVPVPEKDLPVALPTNVEFKPKGDGKSPLNTDKKFVNTKCPQCKKPAEREVDTMDTFVCSSWYFLRYPSAGETKQPFNINRTNYWLPVDMYIGGPEHACMHLLYARFIHKVMMDLGYVKAPEPFKKLVHQGMITKDSAKMSKSKGNVVSPDAFVSKYGADVFRMYLMFMGPFTEGGDWNDRGITGIVRFVERFWKLLSQKSAPGCDIQIERLIHQTITRVRGSIERMHFNTAIAGLMEFVNAVGVRKLSMPQRKTIIQLIAPLAPHLAEELWLHITAETAGKTVAAQRKIWRTQDSIFMTTYPVANPALVQSDTVELVVQVNGKVRAKLSVPRTIDQAGAQKLVLADPNVQKNISGKTIMKEIYVPGRIYNIVVR